MPKQLRNYKHKSYIYMCVRKGIKGKNKDSLQVFTYIDTQHLSPVLQAQLEPIFS